MRPRLPIAARAATVRAGARPSANFPDLAANLEHIVVSMRDWLIEAEASTSSSENYAHNAIGGVPIFAADWSENMTLQFQTDRDGDIASLSIPLEPAVALIFRRMPQPATRTRVPGAAHRPLSSPRHQLSNRFG